MWFGLGHSQGYFLSAQSGTLLTEAVPQLARLYHFVHNLAQSGFDSRAQNKIPLLSLRGILFQVPRAGIEPARPFDHKILSLAWLPITPSGHKTIRRGIVPLFLSSLTLTKNAGRSSRFSFLGGKENIAPLFDSRRYARRCTASLVSQIINNHIVAIFNL
jgi:hypothetical protein